MPRKTTSPRRKTSPKKRGRPRKTTSPRRKTSPKKRGRPRKTTSPRRKNMRYPGEREISTIENEAFRIGLSPDTDPSVGAYFTDVGTKYLGAKSKGNLLDEAYMSDPSKFPTYSPADTKSFRKKIPSVPEKYYARQKIYSMVNGKIDEDRSLKEPEKMGLKSVVSGMKNRDTENLTRELETRRQRRAETARAETARAETARAETAKPKSRLGKTIGGLKRLTRRKGGDGFTA